MTDPRRTLLLSFHHPLAIHYGAGQRTNFLLRALSMCQPTDVAYLTPDSGVESSIPLPDEMGDGRIIHIPYEDRALRNKSRVLLPSPDLTRALHRRVDLSSYGLLVSRYIAPAAKLSLPASVRLVIDHDDPLIRRSTRSGTSTLQRSLDLLNRFLTYRYLASHRGRSAHLLLTSAQDAIGFVDRKCTVLPNIPIPAPISPNASGPVPKTILFVGQLTWAPNAEAMRHFCGVVWPKVLAAEPGAQLRLVGRYSQSFYESVSETPSCTLVGYSDDLDWEYANASFCVVPLQSGGGSNIKLPEAYAHGRAVVCTPLSHHPWSDYFTETKDILIGRTDEELASHCVRLLQVPTLADSLARSGHRVVKHRLGFDAFAAIVASVVSDR